MENLLCLANFWHNRIVNTFMDDSSIYEDLSVDKFWGENAINEPEEEDHRIDLFTEALVFNTVDKVQDQLAALKKENEKLRQENAELRESKQQLSKNISSLFLTARHEMQKKEQEIAKLLSDRQQKKCEPCKVITETAGLKNEKLSSKQPRDACLSSFTRPNDCPREEKTQKSEIRNRLKQEISQSYSLSSCQGVVSRKKKKSDQQVSEEEHKRIHNTANSDIQHTCHKEVKSQHKSSSKGREVLESKQDNLSRSHYNTHTISCTSGHKEPHVSNVDKTIAAITVVAQKHKLNISEVESNVKIRKTAQTDVIRTALIEESKTVGNTEQKADCVEHCSEPDSISVCENKTTSFVIKPSIGSNSKHVHGHTDAASRPINLEITVESKEVDSTHKSLNHNNSAKESMSAASRNHSANSLQYNEKYIKINGNIPVLKIPHSDRLGTISLVDSKENTTEKNVGNGSAYSNTKLEETEINNLEFGNNLMPCKSAYNTSSLAVTSNDLIRNVKDISNLNGSSSLIIREAKQTSYNGKNSKERTRHASTSTDLRKLTYKCNGSNKNSNCNKSGSPFYHEELCNSNSQLDSKIDFSFKSNVVESNADTLQDTNSYITCTSNLILLGDEETTCMTIVSPSKHQPSEFYPPGVRGEVPEGGSHARHIRGATEVIKKLPADINRLFQYEHDNVPHSDSTVVDEEVLAKTVMNVSNTPSFSDSHKTPKLLRKYEDERQASCTKEYVRSLCKASKIRHKSQTCGNLEHVKDSSTESNGKSSDSLLRCDTEQSWISTVSEMFGHVFQKKLHTFKQGTDYQTQTEAEVLKM